jgi:protein TonB
MFSGLSVAQPAARRWTALASFTLQAAVVTSVLVFPMLYPQSLPQIFLTRRIFVPASKGEVRTDARSATSGSRGPVPPHPIVVSRNSRTFVFDPTEPRDSGPPGIDLNPTIGDSNSSVRTLASGPSNPILPTLRPAPPPHTSVMMEGNLIHRVEPQYPVIAKQLGVQGAVVLKAIISRDGNIERVEVASGQVLLARAAKDAVQQWKYRPYLLNGDAIEVETQITVNFVLQR